MTKTPADLLLIVLESRKFDEVKAAVGELEKKHGFAWRAVGDREGNYGTINITSDPGNALVERVTNAIDAVIEREAARAFAKSSKKRPPASPREAVEEWFGVREGRLYNVPAQPTSAKKFSRQELAQNAVISVFDSGSKKRPTMEVRDYGIGLTPAQLPRTILGLNENNKIDKPYLAGAYGQGGSTAFAYSPGTVIASRRQKDLLPAGEPDLVAVTYVRFNELNPEKNKNGRYEYLVQPDNSVPSLPAKVAKEFEAGTSCIQHQMELAQYSQKITQLTGSLWWLFQNSLFDPVLPFSIEEHRPAMIQDGKKVDRRTISGNYTRLKDDKKEKVEHFGSADVTIHHEDEPTVVKVNYWVLRASEEAQKTESPSASYVDPYRPIAFTFNGQTHGTEDRRFIKEEIRLPYLANYLIVQVELDHLSGHARRALLASTRERLKKNELYAEMLDEMAHMLADDDKLAHLNQERKERLLSKTSVAEREKMKQRFARLMERFKAGVTLAPAGKGHAPGGRKGTGGGSPENVEPLPTKEKPTFIKIANKQKPIPIRLERHALIRLESDAPDGYMGDNRRARLTLGIEPNGVLDFVNKTDFVGGRARMSVKPSLNAKAGDTGSLTVFLFTPEEKQLSDKIKFQIVPPEEEDTTGSNKQSKAQVPEPIAVPRVDWPKHSWDETSVASVDDSGSETQIFVNIDNRHLGRLLETGGYQEQGIARMRNNFLLYVAFFAWTQHLATSGKNVPLSGKDFEDYTAQELDRAAQTIAFAISSASLKDGEE